MSDVAAPKATKVASKARVAPSHPTFAVMITQAITALKERTGSSRQAILKYVCANNKVDANIAQAYVNKTLKKMFEANILLAGGAVGRKGAGSYKLAVKQKTAVVKKKVAAKKPAVKKTGKKSAAKKAAAKKPAAKKAAAKKPAVKKAAAKKPAAKKPAVKKAAAKKPAPKTPAKVAKKPAAAKKA